MGKISYWAGVAESSHDCQRDFYGGIVSDDILIGGLLQMAKKQRVEQWAEHRRQCAEEERRQRVMVITEFDAGDPEATMHALADEILKHGLAVRLLAQAIGWADAGAPFGVVGPGPHWRPRRTPEMPDVAPDDADGASPAA